MFQMYDYINYKLFQTPYPCTSFNDVNNTISYLGLLGYQSKWRDYLHKTEIKMW